MGSLPKKFTMRASSECAWHTGSNGIFLFRRNLRLHPVVEASTTARFDSGYSTGNGVPLVPSIGWKSRRGCTPKTGSPVRGLRDLSLGQKSGMTNVFVASHNTSGHLVGTHKRTQVPSSQEPVTEAPPGVLPRSLAGLNWARRSCLGAGAFLMMMD
jgi:hypothetical protein